MTMETADVSDISNSPAYQSLDELVAAGKLTQPQAQLYRSKYAKLHEVVLKTYENEKNLLKKAKLLNQDLTAEKGKLEKTAARAQEDSEVCSSSSALAAAAVRAAAAVPSVDSSAIAAEAVPAAAQRRRPRRRRPRRRRHRHDTRPDTGPGPLHSPDPGPSRTLALPPHLALALTRPSRGCARRCPRARASCRCGRSASCCCSRRCRTSPPRATSSRPRWLALALALTHT